jgi:DNA-binding response OmpR family regulator
MSTKRKDTILIADDNPNNLKVLSETLTEFGYEVRVAMDGKAAVKSAQAEVPDMILLDIHMPEMDGYETCEILKKDKRTMEVPVIFISALNEHFNKIKAFKYGAVDYLTKPIQIEETRARVKVHLELRQKIKELESFNKIMLDREMRIIELKKEVNGMAAEIGKDQIYPEIWNGTLEKEDR